VREKLANRHATNSVALKNAGRAVYSAATSRSKALGSASAKVIPPCHKSLASLR